MKQLFLQTLTPTDSCKEKDHVCFCLSLNLSAALIQETTTTGYNNEHVIATRHHEILINNLCIIQYRHFIVIIIICLLECCEWLCNEHLVLILCSSDVIDLDSSQPSSAAELLNATSSTIDDSFSTIDDSFSTIDDNVPLL